MSTSFILLIIDHISVFTYRFGIFLFIFSSTLFPLIIVYIYEVLYITVKEEISFLKVYI